MIAARRPRKTQAFALGTPGGSSDFAASIQVESIRIEDLFKPLVSIPRAPDHHTVHTPHTSMQNLIQSHLHTQHTSPKEPAAAAAAAAAPATTTPPPKFSRPV